MIEKKYLKLVEAIKNNYILIDNLKILIAMDLLELENLYKDFKTKETVKELEYPSFKSLLLDLIGRSYSRVLPLLRIARYMKKNNISGKDLTNIPISSIELVAKMGIKWSKSVKKDLSNLSYNLLKDKYKK